MNSMRQAQSSDIIGHQLKDTSTTQVNRTIYNALPLKSWLVSTKNDTYGPSYKDPSYYGIHICFKYSATSSSSCP